MFLSGQDLLQELSSCVNQLDASLKQLRVSGTEYANAERDYKLTLRTECLKLRDEGMAIGMIDKVCYGIPAVAEARLKRDISQTVLEANKEAINVAKLKVRILQDQIAREYANA